MFDLLRRQSSLARACAIVAAVAVTAGVLGTGVAAAGSATAAVDARPFVSGDHTIAVFDLADAIIETIEVETGSDGDQDGIVDRVYVRLVRPDTQREDPADRARLSVLRRRHRATGRPPTSSHAATPWPRSRSPARTRSTGCNDVGGELEVARRKGCRGLGERPGATVS